MIYTRKQLAVEVTKEIEAGYDVVKLARWAYAKYLRESNNLQTGLKEVLMDIVLMEEGPEFEMSEHELRELIGISGEH